MATAEPKEDLVPSNQSQFVTVEETTEDPGTSTLTFAPANDRVDPNND